MKVKVERDIDVERLLINLNEKSQCKSVGMAGYDVTVSKQLLRDAHDVIKQLLSETPEIFFDRDNGLVHVFSRDGGRKIYPIT